MSQNTLTVDQIEQLVRFDSATICNAIEVFGVRPRHEGYMDQRIRSMFPALPPMVGYAVTIQFRSAMPGQPGDQSCNFGDHLEAAAAAPQPPVVVFHDLDDPSASATLGEVMCTLYKQAGVAGLVTSGMARDLPQIEPMHFPVFAAGVNPSHANCRFLAVNVPVQVGGLTVNPGDLLHGDANGVTSIPHEIAADTASAAQQIMDIEATALDYLNTHPGCSPNDAMATINTMRQSFKQYIEQVRNARPSTGT